MCKFHFVMDLGMDIWNNNMIIHDLKDKIKVAKNHSNSKLGDNQILEVTLSVCVCNETMNPMQTDT